MKLCTTPHPDRSTTAPLALPSEITSTTATISRPAPPRLPLLLTSTNPGHPMLLLLLLWVLLVLLLSQLFLLS